MGSENTFAGWMQENGLVLRICNGAITICDGDCDNCEDYEDDEYDAYE